jgi:hypothetical protein
VWILPCVLLPGVEVTVVFTRLPGVDVTVMFTRLPGVDVTVVFTRQGDGDTTYLPISCASCVTRSNCMSLPCLQEYYMYSLA